MRLGMLRVLFTTMRLERKDDVKEYKEREHERLDEADEQLEPHEREHEARQEEERGEHGKHDLAAPHIAPKTKREREDPEQLAEELDRSDEDEHHRTNEGSLLERGEVDPAREVRPAVLTDAGRLIPDEPGEGETEVGVVVRGGHVQQLDLPDERDEEQPVADEGEQEQRPEEGQVPDHARTARIFHEAHQTLDDDLDEALEAARDLAHRAGRENAD